MTEGRPTERWAGRLAQAIAIAIIVGVCWGLPQLFPDPGPDRPPPTRDPCAMIGIGLVEDPECVESREYFP